MRNLTLGLSTLCAALLLSSLVACGNDSKVSVPQATPDLQTMSPDPRPTSTEESEPPENDLAKLPLVRKLRAGPLTAKVEYTTQLPVEKWRAGAGKALRVRLTASNKRKSKQKIYLTKATANVTTYNEDGVVDGPQALTDSANINPGFIVTSPNTYNQTFIIPSLDESANQVAIDFTFEFAQEVDKDKNGRDFAKQVATDSLVVPISR